MKRTYDLSDEARREWILNRLRQIVLELIQGGLTRRKIAKAVGVNESTLTRWLKGERRPTVENFVKTISAIDDELQEMARKLNEARMGLEELEDVQSQIDSRPKSKRRGPRG